MPFFKFPWQTFEVTVVWEKGFFSHSARTAAEALQWASCYPVEATVRIWGPRKLRSLSRPLVATRTPVQVVPNQLRPLLGVSR